MMFAIKFKQKLSISLVVICQITSFILRMFGFLELDDVFDGRVTLVSMGIIIIFGMIPYRILRVWNKVDDESWAEKFDKDMKMKNYKIDQGHFEHN